MQVGAHADETLMTSAACTMPPPQMLVHASKRTKGRVGTLPANSMKMSEWLVHDSACWEIDDGTGANPECSVVSGILTIGSGNKALFIAWCILVFGGMLRDEANSLAHECMHVCIEGMSVVLCD